jgi:hypothetical protein
MIQWRNLNIDPDWYVESIGLNGAEKVMGMPVLLDKIREKFPYLRFGYFNPSIPVEPEPKYKSARKIAEPQR